MQNLAGDVQPRYLTGGFLGAAYSPLRVGQDLDNPSNPGFRMTAFDPLKDIPAGRLLGRQQILAGIEPATHAEWPARHPAPFPGARRGVSHRAGSAAGV